LVQNAIYDEKELLLRSAGGDEKAFAEIYHFYYRKVFSLAFKYTKSNVLAEDALQEVFSKLWMQNEKLAAITHFKAYLYTITRNHLFNVLRKISREQLLVNELMNVPLNQPSVVDEITRKQLLEKLHNAVKKLSPRQRQVFELGKLQGVKHEEIAKQMNLSRESVKKYMMDAVKAVKTHLHPRDGLAIFLLLASLK